MSNLATSKRQKTASITRELDRQIKEVDSLITRSSEDFTEYDPAKQEGDTRTTIAIYFVKAYFGLFLLILIGVPFFNLLSVEVTNEQSLVLDLPDLLLTFSSVVGSALGFVIGYYFKVSTDD